MSEGLTAEMTVLCHNGRDDGLHGQLRGEWHFLNHVVYGTSDLAPGGGTESWIGKLDVLSQDVTLIVHGYCRS